MEDLDYQKLANKIRNISIIDNNYTFETTDFNSEIKVCHYLEEFIPNDISLNHFNSKLRSVEKRNPFEEVFSQEVAAFRYYDRVEVNIDGESFTTKRRNFSHKIYLGKRLTKEELIARSLTDENLLPVVATIQIENPSSIIICDNGTVITNLEDDAKTLEEVKENSKQKTIQKNIDHQ